MMIPGKIRFLEFLLLLTTFFYEQPAQAQSELRFIENKNQWPREVDFMARVPGGNVFIESGVWWFSFVDEKKIQERHDFMHREFRESHASGGSDDCVDGQAIGLSFIGANPHSNAHPFDVTPSTYNYFIGNDPGKWGSKAKAYRGILYTSIYSGIDLKVYSEGKNLKYDFVVSAGADPGMILTSYLSGEPVRLNGDGIDVMGSLVSLRELQPVAYQIIGGVRKIVRCQYVLNEDKISYDFPDGYDQCVELIIDPLLIFSTYSGSSADSWGSTATPGENGCLYSSGTVNMTYSQGSFPTTAGAFQIPFKGVYDIGILKYDSSGQQLLFATYLGGSGAESPHSLVMNKQQELLVLGTTGSTDFPTTAGAISRTFRGGSYQENVIEYINGSDILVSKISRDGSQLLASTLIGGTSNDGMNPHFGLLDKNYGDELRGDIITDDSGNIFVSSVTSSPDFPTKNSFNTTYRGGDSDAILMKLNSSLSQILWGAFLGGNNSDASHTLKLDHLGNVFAAGGTGSPDFPSTTGTYQGSYEGSGDGWIAHVTGDGSSIISATFTGTPSFNQVYFLDLNANEEVYVYGQTEGSFPVTSGVYSNPNSGQFVQKFDNGLSTLLFSTVFGSGRGIPDISPTAFLVNNCNNIYMTGWGGQINSFEGFWQSNTFGLPITEDAFQKTTSGSDFYFMVLTDDAKSLLYSTYLGGADSRTHVDGGTSRFDKRGVVYHAVCSGCAAHNATLHATSDFPTTPNAYSRVNGSANCNNAAFKFDLSSLRAVIQTNSVQLNMPGFYRVCTPDKIVFQNLSIGGQIFDWNLGDGTTLIKPDTSLIVHQYQMPGNYTVRLKAIDASTCIGRDSTFANVQVFQPAGTVGSDQLICDGVTTQLQASGGATYAWNSQDSTFVSDQAQPWVTPKDTTWYFVTLTDQDGCVKRDTVKISVVPGIDLKFSATKIYNCFDRPAIRVKNLTDPGEDIFFDYGDGTSSDLSEDVHQFQKDGIYNVRIVGKKDFCVYDKLMEIPIYELKVPNVITPDSSPGANDAFVILYGGKPISQSTLHASVSIYNRWGGKVLVSDDYQDNWTGENIQSGIYYYEVNIAGEINCKGWLQVIKN